jgi:hypothetical protein
MLRIIKRLFRYQIFIMSIRNMKTNWMIFNEKEVEIV